MSDRKSLILFVMQTFYPTYPTRNLEPLLQNPNITLLETYLADDEYPEGVVFCKHPDATGGFSGGGLWATNKRILYTNTFAKMAVNEM